MLHGGADSNRVDAWPLHLFAIICVARESVTRLAIHSPDAFVG